MESSGMGKREGEREFEGGRRLAVLILASLASRKSCAGPLGFSPYGPYGTRIIYHVRAYSICFITAFSDIHASPEIDGIQCIH